MINQATLILFTFLLVSCNQNRDSSMPLDSNGKPDTISSKHISQPIQGSLMMERFSKEFLLDTINQFDKGRNIEITLVIPKSIKGNQRYDKIVSSYLNKERVTFIARIDTRIRKDKSMLKTIPSMFSSEPVSVFSDNKIVSYCFALQKYNAGAAHPLFEYSSINYDKAKGQQIKFSDYFNLKNRNDTIFLLDKINAAINRPNIKLEKLYKLDFNINGESVSFNFDAYELGYGDFPTMAIISKKELSSLINEKYR